MGIWSKKSITQLQAEEGGGHELHRTLTGLNLTLLGIGAIIGAGIFVVTGTAAAQHAGPAILLSFVLAGLGCLFAGLCYAEFAAMIPVAGSAYTYGYATLGELVAWVIGWDLIRWRGCSPSGCWDSWSPSARCSRSWRCARPAAPPPSDLGGPL